MTDIDGYNFKRLRDAIISKSVSNDWNFAKLEWRLESVYSADEPETCLCGHHPIIEICVLRNEKNSNHAEVGNVCVKKFMGIASNKVFDCLRRIRDEITRAPNAETIDLFHRQGVLSDWEWTFSTSTWRKRDLSPKQMDSRISINQKILRSTKKVKL